MFDSKLKLSFLVLCLAALLNACGGSSNSKDPVANDDAEDSDNQVTTDCTITLDERLTNLQNYIPSWEEVECFTDENERLTNPELVLRGLVNSAGVTEGGTSYFSNVLDYWDEIYQDYHSNISTQVFGMLPPYYPNSWDLTTGQELYLDERLRSAGIAYTREKRLGRSVLMIAFTPPEIETVVQANEEDFFVWLREVFIPVKIQEAQAAEKIKVESYVPWPLEMEVFIRDLGGEGNGGFIESMTDAEKVIFAQTVIDEIRDAVRPHFSGKLVAHSYHNYLYSGTIWNQLSYQGFDEIHFAFFPGCSVEETVTYMDTQLENYQMVIDNSGGLPWQANEISVNASAFVCDTPLEDIEQDVYEVIFDKLMNGDNPPVGLSVAVIELVTEEAKQYVQSYFASLSVDD